MMAWKLAPALACGNTVVIKPAETTSLTALRLAEILQECELPPGVVNVVTGGPKTGELLVGSPGIDKIAFTGSTEVGKRIAAEAAPRGIPLTLELGGKSPNLIFADAPVDQAIEGIVKGIWFNQGQVCCAGSRVIVEESILQDVVRRLEHRLGTLRVGDPLDKNTDVGAINSPQQLETIRRYVGIGRKEGATLHEVNGSRLPRKGFWCRPAFFTGVQPSHVIAREEIFGPVLAVMRARDFDHALELAVESTPYRLTGGGFSRKPSHIERARREFRVGKLYVNRGITGALVARQPFGGFGMSGVGSKAGGADYLLQFVEPRAVCENTMRRGFAPGMDA